MREFRPSARLVYALPLLFMLSCSTDFDTYIESQPTPIIYAAINPEDSVYSVRLTKSFVGAGSALDFAQIEDSLYYSEAEVLLTTWHKGNMFQSVQLERVEANPREPGMFLTSPNYLYQASMNDLAMSQEVFEALGVEYDLELRMQIILPDNPDTISAVSRLLSHPRVINPRFIFKKVYFYGEQPFQMEWAHPVAGNYYEIGVTMRYRELLASGEERRTSSHWVLRGIEYNESSVPGSMNNVYSYFMRPESFYSQLSAAIEDDKEVKARIFTGVDFVILTAEPALKEYIRIFNMDDDYRGASFSNIQNGLGLFYTFIETGVYDLELGQRELDSLAAGRYTKNLRFKNWL